MDTIFQKGKCLECDKPVPTGQILCDDHYIPNLSEFDLGEFEFTEKTVSKMVEGDVGYTEEYALFELNGRLWILGTAKIIPESEGYKTMKVKVRKNIFEIDKTTIDTNDIFIGKPDVADETPVFQAKLV